MSLSHEDYHYDDDDDDDDDDDGDGDGQGRLQWGRGGKVSNCRLSRKGELYDHQMGNIPKFMLY